MSIRVGQRYRTNSLFVEFNTLEEPALFTILKEDKTKDGVLYPSLRRIYMDCLDPTEQKFVNDVFGGDWDQWRKITRSDYLRNALKLDEWQPELEVRLRSLGITGMVNIAKDTSHKSSGAAAKWLAEGGWRARERGRPSKEELEGRAKVEEQLGHEFAHLWESIKESNDDA